MNKKLKIVADNKIPFLKGVLEPYGEVVYLPGAEISKEAVRDADALLVRTRTRCSGQLLEASGVKFIGTATIGYDHIDVEYCDSKKIKWVNAPGCNSYSVMQYVTASIAAVLTGKKLRFSDLSLGVVGVGNVGSKVVKAAKALGMKVMLNDPPRMRAEGESGFVSLERIIEECDIISFHTPLLKNGEDKTLHLADETFFEKLKRCELFINTSRGPVVKTAPLISAIRNGTVRSSVIDVWENEPQLDRSLLGLADIGTPHIAGYSTDGKANGTAICVRELNKFFGLGMEKDWYSAEIPPPGNSSEISLDCSDKTVEEAVNFAVRHSYNVLRDDKLLRESPEQFELQRNQYPVRREFPSYGVKLQNDDRGIGSILREIGFKIQ